jgi:hypothetical protein
MKRLSVITERRFLFCAGANLCYLRGMANVHNNKRSTVLLVLVLLITAIAVPFYMRVHPHGCALASQQAHDICIDDGRRSWFDHHLWKDGPFNEDMYSEVCTQAAVRAAAECWANTGESGNLPDWQLNTSHPNSGPSSIPLKAQ